MSAAGSQESGDVIDTDVDPVVRPAVAAVVIPAAVQAEILAHAYACYPDEACGLIAGVPGGSGPTRVERFYPCRNGAESARVYTIEPKDHLRSERDAEDHGWEIVGVVHSHTHTEPYPSPTDVAQAPDPTWQYVIVSLKRATPEMRSYRIDASATAGTSTGIAGIAGITDVPIALA